MDDRRPVATLAARALAVILPLSLVGLAFARLGTGLSDDARRQLDNAGQLLNGEVLKVPVTDAIRTRMSASPRLVVLGNSHANTNVHLITLAPAFGIESREATRLSIPNTVGAHWYAILRHHVFVPGIEPPDWVVITADLQSALLTEPQSEGSHGNLLSLLPGPDPVVDARVARDTSFWWSTVLSNRDQVRRNALDAVRDRAVRPVLRNVPRSKVHKVTNDAMDEVFHPSRTDLSLFRNAMPVAVDDAIEQHDPDDLPSPEDSFLPEIAKLCAQHGARLILVRNLPSPAVPPGKGDRVRPGTEARLRELLDPHGGILLDFSRLPMVADLYTNLDHMTEEGARRFTRALAEGLVDLGIGDEPEAFVRPEPLGPPIGGSAVPAELAGIRQSWVAVPSDGVVSWTGQGWTGTADTFRVRLVMEPTGEARPTVQIAGMAARVERLPSGRWIAEHAGPPPTGTWTVDVRAEGGGIVVQGLEVGAGATPRYAVGYRPDVRGPRLELLGRVEIFDGEAWLDPVRPIVPLRVPPVPRAGRGLSDGPGLTAMFEVPRLTFLSDFETRQHTPRHARCSPIRVIEDGEPLPLPNVGCKEVRDHGAGRSCHAEQRVLFAATDATDPSTNGRSYRLALDPERRCDGGVWLYPGDAVRVPVPPRPPARAARRRLLAAGEAVRAQRRTSATHGEGPAGGHRGRRAARHRAGPAGRSADDPARSSPRARRRRGGRGGREPRRQLLVAHLGRAELPALAVDLPVVHQVLDGEPERRPTGVHAHALGWRPFQRALDDQELTARGRMHRQPNRPPGGQTDHPAVGREQHRSARQTHAQQPGMAVALRRTRTLDLCDQRGRRSDPVVHPVHRGQRHIGARRMRTTGRSHVRREQVLHPRHQRRHPDGIPIARGHSAHTHREHHAIHRDPGERSCRRRHTRRGQQVALERLGCAHASLIRSSMSRRS
jgi:hypothetical protein